MEKQKFDFVKAKERALTCIADNIDEQNSSTYLILLMNAIDLYSN